MATIWITRSEDDEWDAYYERPEPYDHQPYNDNDPARVHWRTQIQLGSAVEGLCVLLDIPVGLGEARKVRISWEDLQRNEATLVGEL